MEAAPQKGATLARDALTARECIERATRQKQGKVRPYLRIFTCFWTKVNKCLYTCLNKRPFTHARVLKQIYTRR